MVNIGSAPIILTKYIGSYFSWLEYHADNVRVTGSSPVEPTKYKLKIKKNRKNIILTKKIIFIYKQN